MENLAKQVKLLKIYIFVLTLILIAFMAYILRGRSGNYKEITAERINIVEKSGKLRMVISNRQNQHPGIMDNKTFPKRDRPAGMIFFNDDGDECGGLVYDGDKKSASFTYSIDQYKNDQIMQLQYLQDGSGNMMERSYGLKLWDRNDQFTLTKRIAWYDSLKNLNDTNALNAGVARLKASGFTAERLFAGRNKAGEVGLFLSDSRGIPRLRIYINKLNQPVIETLDEKGVVISSR